MLMDYGCEIFRIGVAYIICSIDFKVHEQINENCCLTKIRACIQITNNNNINRKKPDVCKDIKSFNRYHRGR